MAPTPPGAAERLVDRQQAEEDLLTNRVKALVATTALGIGFDKPDLGFVVRLGSSSSPIAYYQQAAPGRALGQLSDRLGQSAAGAARPEDSWPTRW